MLRSSSAAAPRIVAAVCCVVERPIDESTAIQPERTYCAGGAAACCCDLHRRSPTIIPAERQRFSSPKVRHAPDKLYCRFHNVFSFRVKIIREIFKQLDRVLLRNGQRTHGNIQAAEIFEQNVQRVVLVFGKAVFHPHLFGGFGCDRDGQRNPRVAVVHIVVRITVWNVNGLRACLKKGFEDVFNTLDADFFCIQETKMQPGQADFAPEGYTEYIYSADKKGYSGTAIWAREPALSVRYGLDEDIHNHEGRAITLEYPDFYLVNLYVPNSQNELARIDYRMQWEDDLRRYLQKLDAEKPVILCGDLNVAHEDIDLKNPGPNRGAAGFSDQERGKLGELLAAGFTDSFRHLHPDATGMYSWWSMRFRARERNAGWRIDYFLVSDRIADKIQTAAILMEVMGSDHCPVELDINL